MHINPQQVTCFPNFGPHGFPGVEVDVPRMWKENESPSSGCAAVLYTKDNVIVGAKWSGLWVCASAVNAMCVRQGMAGQYKLRDVDDPSKEMIIGLMSAWPPPLDAL